MHENLLRFGGDSRWKMGSGLPCTCECVCVEQIGLLRACVGFSFVLVFNFNVEVLIFYLKTF